MQIRRLLFQTIFHFWNLFCNHHFNLFNAIRNFFPNSWAHLLLKNGIVYDFQFFPHPRPKPAAGFTLFLLLPSLPDENPRVLSLGKKVQQFFCCVGYWGLGVEEWNGIGFPCLPVLDVQPKAAVTEYPAGLGGLIWYMTGEGPLSAALSWCWQDLSYFLSRFCLV